MVIRFVPFNSPLMRLRPGKFNEGMIVSVRLAPLVCALSTRLVASTRLAGFWLPVTTAVTARLVARVSESDTVKGIINGVFSRVVCGPIGEGEITGPVSKSRLQPPLIEPPAGKVSSRTNNFQSPLGDAPTNEFRSLP